MLSLVPGQIITYLGTISHVCQGVVTPTLDRINALFPVVKKFQVRLRHDIPSSVRGNIFLHRENST